jgi:hypothetical protein
MVRGPGEIAARDGCGWWTLPCGVAFVGGGG